MTSHVQPILEGFMALRDNSSRRAVINGIISNLSAHEIREVKSRFGAMTFQCDLLDKLPVEIVAMLAEYLELADIVLLRRVSKRWHELLSSTIVVTTAIISHMGKNAMKADLTPADPEALIRKRIRAERGKPAVVTTIPNNLSRDLEKDLHRDGISCFNGVCAWIEESTDRTTIFMVHLPTGKNRTLTTANREEFTHVQVSDTLISATSVRGYCHVWNMPKEQYKSFRIPSLQFTHYISIGSKVMLSYVDSVVHFCFDSGVARSVRIGLFILLLSVHAEDDAFTVFSICRKDGDNIELPRDGVLCSDEHHLKTQRFSVHENQFIRSWEQYRELPFGDGSLWQIQSEPEDPPVLKKSLRPGQSSALLSNSYGMDAPCDSISLSLEADDQVTVHFHSVEVDSKNKHANLDYSARGPGLSYCFEDYAISEKTRLCIGREFPELSDVFDAKGCRFQSTRTVDFPNNRPSSSILGDGDFVILPDDDKIWIWCFDEAWLPFGIPYIRSGLQLDDLAS
ncbi:hypothetical protein N7472_003512 [Penicillium cf. griseofulvum]|uniref:F-box domain-containing protein n=1 Tax=Penicillium cf. griseofulvum TaxID=2972120 RepID=A0A9W9T2H9_9EURO|nr:hypothetical protein N7472_003512 [Penicillium cf. griseofulvum]